MSRRPQASHAAISLFPFLDVLMCTMGALILLLIALAIRMSPTGTLEEMLKQAKAGLPLASQPTSVVAPADVPPAADPSVEAEAEEQRQRDLAERARLREQRQNEWSAALTTARGSRDRERLAVEKLRQMLADAQDKIREARARAATAAKEDAAAQAAREAGETVEEQLKLREEQLRAQIETARRKLDVEHRKQATRSNEYALVPYDGTSGTMRRPIYIECTSRGLRFVQENLSLSTDDLDGFRKSFNPLLAATDALMRYWNLRRAQSGGDEPEPYVLLIVRPSGIMSYMNAR